MRAFSKALYPSVRDDTFMESCGVGDLVVRRGEGEGGADGWADLSVRLGGRGRVGFIGGAYMVPQRDHPQGWKQQKAEAEEDASRLVDAGSLTCTR